MGALRQIAERIVRPVAMPDAHPGALDGLLPVCRMGLPVAQHPADTSPVLREQYQWARPDARPRRHRGDRTRTVPRSLPSRDWLVHDSAPFTRQRQSEGFVGQHPNSLVVCRVCVNTRKHMVRGSPRRTDSRSPASSLALKDRQQPSGTAARISPPLRSRLMPWH
jgi:hypothetical protein